MKLSVIIINYNCFDILDRCVSSIICSCSHEIIIIDNDGHLPDLSRKSVQIIPFAGNDGFSGANNRALKLAKGEYVLFLNADVFLTSGYIDACIGYLEGNNSVSSVQGKLLKERNHKLIDSTGNVVTTSYFAFNENHLSADWRVPTHEIFGVCCAAGVFRRAMLDEVAEDGACFDNDFFAYLEDVDLNIRLRKAGYPAYFLGFATGFHIREASSKFFFRFKQSILNRFLLVVKHGSGFYLAVNFVLVLPVVLAIVPKRRITLKKISSCYKKRHHVERSALILDSNFRFLQHVFKRLWNA